mmetsp:Transcript_27570/g.79428  ORF Transcript_27570/g.79428 Transcript_27570/m.79428 type:complete len:285 (-) Transcript_27570:1139-1993(-)
MPRLWCGRSGRETGRQVVGAGAWRDAFPLPLAALRGVPGLEARLQHVWVVGLACDDVVALPRVQEAHLLEVQHVPCALLIQTLKEGGHVAGVPIAPASRAELAERNLIGLVNIDDAVGSTDSAELDIRPHLELHACVVGDAIQIPERDEPAEVSVESAPCASDVAGELDALGGINELPPCAAVRVILVQGAAPAPEAMPVLSQQRLLELIGGLLARLGKEPIGRLEALDDLHIRLRNSLASLAVEGRRHGMSLPVGEPALFACLSKLRVGDLLLAAAVCLLEHW